MDIDPVANTRRILKGMERAANDVGKRRAILRVLRERPQSAEEMFVLGLRFNACEERDKEHLRNHWGNEDSEGWFGEIMDQVNRGFVRALMELGDDPYRELRVDWTLRDDATFHIEIDRTPWGVSMRIVTPTPLRENFLAK